MDFSGWCWLHVVAVRVAYSLRPKRPRGPLTDDPPVYRMLWGLSELANNSGNAIYALLMLALRK